jgi:hypothetical protein
MPSSSDERPLRERLIAELAGAPDGLSLPRLCKRLCKRLGVRMSVLLREIAWLGDQPIGDKPGAGLVQVREHGELRIARLERNANQPTADAGSLHHRAAPKR